MKRRLSTTGALLVALAACTDASPRTPVGPDGAAPAMAHVSSVHVCCPATVYEGARYDVWADVYDNQGQPLYNQPVYWSTSGNGVASIAGISNYAEVTAVAPGTTTFYALVDGLWASTSLTVLARPRVTTVQITPSPVKVQVGESRQLTARVYDQYGNQMTGQTVAWSIDHPSVASLGSGGMLQGAAVGTTTARATVSGVTGTASVTVEPYFAVSISGPLTVTTAGEYNWTATATGGTGGYSYRWWIEWNSAPGQLDEHGTASTATLWVDEYTPSYFILYVEATSGSQKVTAQRGVCNFTASAMC
jgi:hypothetical protein